MNSYFKYLPLEKKGKHYGYPYHSLGYNYCNICAQPFGKKVKRDKNLNEGSCEKCANELMQRISKLLGRKNNSILIKQTVALVDKIKNE